MPVHIAQQVTSRAFVILWERPYLQDAVQGP